MTLKWLFTLSTFPLEKQRHILIDWGMIRLEILEAGHRNTYISWMSFGSKEIKLLPYNTHHGSPTLPRENYGSLELKTQRVSNGWTLGSLNLRRDSRGSQEQWLLFCLFTPCGGGLWIMSYRKRCRFSIYFCPCVSPCSNNSPVFFIQMSSPEFSVGGSTML